MKKLIAVLTLCLAFTISANAQEKKESPDQAAKKDVAALLQKVTLNESLTKDMYTLMVMKHESLSNDKLTAAEKTKISKAFENKIMSGLDEQQRQTLINNPALLKQLTN